MWCKFHCKIPVGKWFSQGGSMEPPLGTKYLGHLSVKKNKNKTKKKTKQNKTKQNKNKTVIKIFLYLRPLGSCLDQSDCNVLANCEFITFSISSKTAIVKNIIDIITIISLYMQKSYLWTGLILVKMSEKIMVVLAMIFTLRYILTDLGIIINILLY